VLPPPPRVPAGYERRDVGTRTLIARSDVAGPLAAAIARTTLIDFAAGVPGARPLQGRLTAYAIAVDGGTRVVVRRNHHGGIFRGVTGSRFLWPTRAPRELETSVALQRLGIPTPPVLAIAIYRHGLTAMSDVVTGEIAPSEDFGASLRASSPGSDERRAAWSAVRSLLALLAKHGVRHHDLNVKNILLHRAGSAPTAWLLDVDRVAMDRPDADTGNRSRLARSLLKWRDTQGVQVSAAEIEALLRTGPSTP
jgi:hypothetical protein